MGSLAGQIKVLKVLGGEIGRAGFGIFRVNAQNTTL
jgi:hypothetical protein